MERRVIYFLYRLLGTLAFPFLLIYLLVRIVRDPRYRDKARERFGFLTFQPTQRAGIWLHAVSVGEVLAAAELVKQFAARYPGTAIYVSVTTLAGRELAEKRLRGEVAGLFYVPFDYCWMVRRVLRAIDPAVVVILETEIWPNLWRETKRRGAGLVVLNARISDRAWPRYQRLSWFFAPVLGLPDRVLAQSAADRHRYAELGARAELAGNLKYDIEPPAPPAEISAWIDARRPAKIWIAASTMPAVIEEDREEDEIVADAFLALEKKWPRLLLILAPRKPERFAATAAMLSARGIRFVRRTQLCDLELPGVLLLDSIGELAGLFAKADAVFVGGSLVHWGGHNVLEPAWSARPIVCGPHMQNFASMAQEFLESDAYVEVARPVDLMPAVDRLLRDPGEVGARALQCASRHRGAAPVAVAAIQEVMEASVTHEPGRRWMTPLTWLWRAGVVLDRAWRTRRDPLPAPVISVGNLTVGGVGKTPLVAWLAEKLPDPAILMRGHGRASTEDLILKPGAAAPVRETGDEAQEHLRDGFAAVGIGADRRRVAAELFNRFRPRCFLLDDGYQHWPIPRQLNVVVVDVQDPFGGGHLLPRGRLREPLSALERADVIVLSRVQAGFTYPRLTEILRRHNERAPIVRMRTAGARIHPAAAPGTEFEAVCGLGNPGAFWATLGEMGVKLRGRRAFPDHHVYSAGDFAGVETAVLTTGKDLAKIVDLNLALPVYWVEARVEIPEAGEFVDLAKAVII